MIFCNLYFNHVWYRFCNTLSQIDLQTVVVIVHAESKPKRPAKKNCTQAHHEPLPICQGKYRNDTELSA